jgi:hypothetical protein
MFDFGYGPIFVAKSLGIKQQTAFTYFQQWKQLPPAFRARYAAARRSFRHLDHRDRRTIAGFLAQELDTSEEQVMAHMSKPSAAGTRTFEKLQPGRSGRSVTLKRWNH